MLQFVITHTVTRPTVGTPSSMNVQPPFPGTGSLENLLGSNAFDNLIIL
jgi:hypothetical protein